MQTFNEWWARQYKDPTKPIGPREAWDAALATANTKIVNLHKRIRELEGTLSTAVNTGMDSLASERDALTKEQMISDKLEKALWEYRAFFGSISVGQAVLNEVAAIRAKQT